MTDTKNPDARCNPHNPVVDLIFPDEECEIIESLRPERLVERAIAALWCFRNDRPDLARTTLVLGTKIATENGFASPYREPVTDD